MNSSTLIPLLRYVISKYLCNLFQFVLILFNVFFYCVNFTLMLYNVYLIYFVLVYLNNYKLSLVHVLVKRNNYKDQKENKNVVLRILDGMTKVLNLRILNKKSSLVL